MLAALIEGLTRLFAPWQAFYADSRLTETLLTSTHVVAMLVGGGLAVAADRTTLRAARAAPGERELMLEHLHQTHRPVLIALGVLFVSGLALAAADIPTYSKSVEFLVKLSFVTVLCINGAFLSVTEGQLRRAAAPPHWRRLYIVSWISLLLWIGTAVASVVLTDAG
ncbi:MAG: hypothetical protein ABJC19_09910 [Gemmatimonadota bacterium]